MVNEQEINKLVERRIKRTLDYCELTVPSEKYPRLRTLILDEFGHSGLRCDLAELLRRGGQGGI